MQVEYQEVKRRPNVIGTLKGERAAVRPDERIHGPFDNPQETVVEMIGLWTWIGQYEGSVSVLYQALPRFKKQAFN